MSRGRPRGGRPKPRMARGRTLRRARRAPASTPVSQIPDKLYFRIREVSELTQTKAYVLRYWETEFPTLKPQKSRSGHRLYRRQDVQTILEIKRLLYQEGFTIEGARNHLARDSEGGAKQANLFGPTPESPHLRSIKRELEGVLTLLSRKC